MASKKQMEAFNKKVEKIVLTLGGEKEPSNWYTWFINTKAGKLYVTVHQAEASNLFSIFCRFDDPKLANEMLPENLKGNLNEYSGKWNFHYKDESTCLNVFTDRIQAIESVTELAGLYDIRIHFSSTLPLDERIARSIRDCFLRHDGVVSKALFDETIKAVGARNPEYKKVWKDFKKTFEIKTKDGKYINPFQV